MSTLTVPLVKTGGNMTTLATSSATLSKGYSLILNRKTDRKRIELPRDSKPLTVGSDEGADIKIPSLGETQGAFTPTTSGVKYSTRRGEIFTAKIPGIGIGILNATLHPGQTIEFPDGYKVTVKARY